jgi:hypothetical protein
MLDASRLARGRRLLPLALAACLLALPTLRAPAQQADSARAAPGPAPEAAPRPAVKAAPTDVASAEAIVAAVYDAISGPAGGRDWDRFRSLFAPGARLIPSIPDSTGGARAAVLSVEEYVGLGTTYFKDNGFFEREAAQHTETFGNIAHRWSVYESRHAEQEAEPFQRGINSIQLLKDGGRWWIVTIFWDNERPDNTIPAEYLKGGG